jgi:hypothetical protein
LSWNGRAASINFGVTSSGRLQFTTWYLAITALVASMSVL